MRWMKTAVLSIACLAFAAGMAKAETNWVGFSGGLAMPTGDFSDAASTGFNFGASGTWMFTPAVGVGVDLGYFMWNGSDELNDALTAIATAAEGTPTDVEAKFSAIQAGGHLMYMFPSSGSIKPWLKGGLGIYNFKFKTESDNSSYEGDDSESNMGINVGGGINMGSSPNMSYGIGAAYHTIFTEDESTSLFTVNLNVMFGMGGPQ